MHAYSTHRCHYPAGFRPGPQAARAARRSRIGRAIATAVGLPLVVAPWIAALTGADLLFWALQVPLFAFVYGADRLGWLD